MNNTIAGDVENRIADELEKQGWKPASFAKYIDVPSSTIYSITRGQTKLENIGAGLFIKIAKGLNKTPEQLYYGLDGNDLVFEEIEYHYNHMTEEGRKALLGTARGLASTFELKNNQISNEERSA